MVDADEASPKDDEALVAESRALIDRMAALIKRNELLLQEQKQEVPQAQAAPTDAGKNICPECKGELREGEPCAACAG